MRRDGCEAKQLARSSSSILRVPKQPAISSKSVSLPAHGDSTTQGRGPIVDNENDTKYNCSGIATSSKPDELKYRYAVVEC